MTNGSTRGTPGVLAVICDVGPSTGIGHLMRCVALAEEFAARGSRVVLVADVAAVPFALEQVARRGFAHLAAPGSTGEYLEVLAGLGADAVVIDSYLLPDDLYAAVAAAYPTLVIVDGDPGGRVGTVLVDQNIGAEDDPWPVPEGSTRLAGLDFALMR
ncbi:MAG: spore coat protein, partial [Marmoricola sp.]